MDSMAAWPVRARCDDLPRLLAIGGGSRMRILSLSGGARETTCPGRCCSWACRRDESGQHLQIILRHELADGQFALHQHGQRGSLHAAHGEVLSS